MNPQDQHKKELEQLAPLLSSLGKREPFSAPAGYFDSFSEELDHLILAEKKEPFRAPAGYFETLPQRVMSKVAPSYLNAPEGYFDTLHSRIMERVEQEAGKETKVIRLEPVRIITTVTVAASLLVVAWFGFGNGRGSGIQEGMALKKNLTIPEWPSNTEEKKEAEAIILAQVDADLIADIMEEAEPGDQEKEKDVAAEPQKNDIENYLMEQDIDEQIMSTE